MKQSRLVRGLRILVALQSGRHFRIDDLIDMLSVSKRTVYRDLRALQNAGVPIYYEKKERSYTLNPDFFLPAPALNTQEALGFLLLVYEGRNYINTPYMDSALRAALKIESTLPVEIKNYCNAAIQNITIMNTTQYKNDFTDNVFFVLLESILKNNIVEICYKLPLEDKSMYTDLSPYHLLYIEDMWHVLGESSFDRGFRIFKLNRIKELNKSYKRFIRDDKFNIGEYLGRAWSVSPEGRLYNIKLRFTPEVADSVAAVQWHKTQMVGFNDDGSVIIEFRVDGLNEITWWILSYGNQVQVLAPKILRKKIAQIAQEMVTCNKQDLPVE